VTSWRPCAAVQPEKLLCGLFERNARRNGWDVIGAKSAGLRAVWVRRNPDQVLDPWGIEPDLIVQDLTECARSFDEFDAR